MKEQIPNLSKEIKLKIHYIYVSLAIIVMLAFIIFLWIYPKYNKEYGLVEVMTFLTGSVAIVSLIYHSISISNNIEIHKQNVTINLMKYTFDVVATFHDPKMNSAIKTLREIKNDEKKYLEKKNMDEFTDYLKKNPDSYANIVQIFNYFEHVSLLVVSKQVDEPIIKSSFKTLFLSTYKEYRFYIDERQKTHHSTWIEYEKLCKCWLDEV